MLKPTCQYLDLPPPKNKTIPNMMRPIMAMILMLANQNSLSPYKLTTKILRARIVISHSVRFKTESSKSIRLTIMIVIHTAIGL